MSSVKIYTAVSEDLSPLIHGEGFCVDMVRYSDYAAIEAKCEALAAQKERFAVECAAAKIAIAYLKSGRQDFSLNTPATDAFLAEVRAQGVEMYAANLDSGADDAERRGFDDAVKFLQSEASAVRLFAAQLRGNSNGGAL